MSFLKDNNLKEASQNQLSGFLAQGCSFEGTLIFEGTLRIDGLLTGKVICKPDQKGILIVGEKGRVELDLLSVDSLLVSGQFYGNGPIIALDVANFHGNSRIEVQKNHSLYSSNLIIKEKALFQGKSVMIRHETSDTKSEIKRLIYSNRKKMIKLPFDKNSLLQNINET